MKSLLKLPEIFISFILYKISKGKISTKTAKEYRRLAIEKNQTRIDEMQSALDMQHSRLRGWTMNTSRNETIKYDHEREAALAVEIARTRKVLGLNA